MPKIKKSHPLIRLWGYARAHHRDMLLASLYSILNKIFDLAPPLLIGAAVDTVIQSPLIYQHTSRLRSLQNLHPVSTGWLHGRARLPG